MPKAHQIAGALCNGVCEKGELKAKDMPLFLKTTAKTVSYPIIFNGKSVRDIKLNFQIPTLNYS